MTSAVYFGDKSYMITWVVEGNALLCLGSELESELFVCPNTTRKQTDSQTELRHEEKIQN